MPLCWIVNFNIKLTWETRYKKNQNYLSPTFHCKCTIYNPRWGEMVHLTQCKESTWKWSFFFFLSFVSGVGSFTIVDGNKIKGEDVGNKWVLLHNIEMKLYVTCITVFYILFYFQWCFESVFFYRNTRIFFFYISETFFYTCTCMW